MRSVARFVLYAAVAMLLAVTLVAVAAIAAPAATTAPATPPAATPEAPVKLQSLRGDTPIDKTKEPDLLKVERDSPIPRGSTFEPPLIPHSIRGYQITTNFNKCMDCHAWSKVKESGATKVSVTHFKDSTGRELANISPRRYVCTTCHVQQTDAKPLVGNTFRPSVEFVQKK